MQVHPVEVWDLLDLLGLPPEWTVDAFLKFFDDLDHPSPSPEALERMAHLFRAVERDFGRASTETAQRVTGLSRLKAAKVLRALRDAASIPRRQMETPERRAALALVRGAHTNPTSGFPAHSRIAPPLLQVRDAVDADRGAPGRGPIHRHDARRARALRRRRRVHRLYLRQGVLAPSVPRWDS